jgi:hypothetical protein
LNEQLHPSPEKNAIEQMFGKQQCSAVDLQTISVFAQACGADGGNVTE